MKYPARRRPAPSWTLALPLAVALQATASQAQTQATPPAPAASGPQGANISDRVKKDAASPLYWIRLNAQKADAASSGSPKPARITEVRSEPRPPRPAPPANQATPPAPNPTAATAVAPQPLLSASPGPSTSPEAQQDPSARESATVAAPVTAGALVAPTGAASAATDAARAAAAAAAEDDADEQPLTLVKGEEPSFPATAMRKLRKGTVQVRFDVLADGTVANPSVVQTSHRSLNEAALEAVGAWRFQPVRGSRTAVVDLGFDLDG